MRRWDAIDTALDIIIGAIALGCLLFLLMGCGANHYISADTGADVQGDVYPYAGVSYATDHPCSLSVGWWVWVEDPSVNGPYGGVGCSWTIWSKRK